MSYYEWFDLTGKTAVITGGGRGLGAVIAETYAEAGANIVICSRKLEACENLKRKLEQKGTKALALSCDVTKKEDVESTIATVVNEFGRIDILVNNSGVSWAAPVEEMTLEAWQKVIDVNVTGTFLMSQGAGKVMIEQQAGKIINLASIAGFGGTPPFMQTIGYNTSKGAIMTFTQDLAVKWGQYNINVNAIAPGFLEQKCQKY